MGRKSPHHRIIDQLAAFNEKDKYYEKGKIFYGHGGKGSRHPAPIVQAIGSRPFTYPYYPDCLAQKRGKVDVYEVWHTEDETSAIEDIVLSALIKGIYTFTVFCTGYEISVERAKELCNFILSFVKDENGERLLRWWHVVEIPESVWKDDKKIYQLIANDPWMKSR
jgi:hypothetical protein